MVTKSIFKNVTSAKMLEGIRALANTRKEGEPFIPVRQDEGPPLKELVSEDKLHKPIYVTTDYSLFTRHPLNRTPTHYKTIAKSIERDCNLLGDNPITISPSGRILEGQNRAYAAMMLGLPIYYYIKEADVDDYKYINVVNAHRYGWNTDQQVESGCNGGVPFCMQINELSTVTGMKITDVTKVLNIKKQKVKNLVEKAIYPPHEYTEISDWAMARAHHGLEAFKMLKNDLKRRGKSVGNLSRVLEAFASISDKFDLGRWAEQLEKYGYEFHSAGSSDDYKDVIMKVYNSGKWYGKSRIDWEGNIIS